jgi:hypothetical protein
MRKGMSQAVGLMVTAAVLVMAALTVMYLFTDFFQDTDNDLSVTQCQQSVNSRCLFGGGDVPASCEDDSGNVPSDIAGQVNQLETNGLSCSSGSNEESEDS